LLYKTNYHVCLRYLVDKEERRTSVIIYRKKCTKKDLRTNEKLKHRGIRKEKSTELEELLYIKRSVQNIFYAERLEWAERTCGEQTKKLLKKRGGKNLIRKTATWKTPAVRTCIRATINNLCVYTF